MAVMAKYNFDDVYAETKDIVWKLVSKYVSTKEDREDLFQEIFLRIHNALHRFRGESALTTWVYRIAVNTSINFVNKHNRYKWLKKIIGIEKEETVEAPKIENDIKLFKPLEKLNPQQKMILLLSEVEDKKLGEISEMMKLPVGTVKSNLHRAREIIKKEVEKNG